MAFPRVLSLPSAAVGALYLVLYVALDWVSFVHPFAPFGITPWNPPTGLSFVVVLLFGQRFIPLLFVAPALADLIVRQLPLGWPVELATMSIIGIGYSAALSFLLRPATRFNPALPTMRDLLLLIAVAALSAAFVASAYVGTLIATGWIGAGDFLSASLRYWVGDVIGVAVVSPFALIFLTRGRTPKFTAEMAVQIAAIVVALLMVFGLTEEHRFQLFYVLFLPIIWIAVRSGLEGVTAGILLTQLGLMLGLHLKAGGIDVTPFQALMLILTLTGLMAGMLVTENRRTEFQLRLHQNSLARLGRLGSMGELASAVAHEVNQPLTAAGTYSRLVVDTLRAEPSHNPATVETAEKTAVQVERAAEVLKRLRALIRLDQTGRAPSSVERIVNETMVMCQPEIDRHNIKVMVDLDDKLPAVMVDLLQIEQVLINLVRNSVEAIAQAGDAGGSIAVEGRLAGADTVRIGVRDSGPGFPEGFGMDELPPLSSTKSGGLGVGLSLSRRIVEAHGGKFTLERARPGAVVSFTLPVAGRANG